MEWQRIIISMIFMIIVFLALWLIVNGMIERAGMVAGTLFINPQELRKKGMWPYSFVGTMVLIIVAVVIIFLLVSMLFSEAGKPLSAVFYDLFGSIF